MEVKFAFVAVQTLPNAKVCKFALSLIITPNMPVVRTAEVLSNPQEFVGVNPEDVVRLVKSFDSSERKLLPQNHRMLAWANMTAIQRQKMLNSLPSTRGFARSHMHAERPSGCRIFHLITEY